MSSEASNSLVVRSERSPQRIVDAAVRRFARSTPSSVSLSDIAAEAGVSKALILYHFGDRDSLIANVVDSLATGIVERERVVLQAGQGALAVDALWHLVESELARGDVRVLLSLGELGHPAIRAAAERAAARRRAAAEETVSRLFRALGLRPRVLPRLIGDVAVAFTNGLAFDTSRTPAAQRLAFDVFWLAMLDLVE